MAKLEITGDSLTGGGLDVRIDGVKIEKLKDLRFSIERDSINIASITFYVDKVDIDSNFLAELHAIQEDKQHCRHENVLNLQVMGEEKPRWRCKDCGYEEGLDE